MEFVYSPTQQEIREAVGQLSRRFPDSYWRKCEHEKSYPQAFVDAMNEAGWLATLIL